MVANAGYRLLIDSERGTIVSFRSTFGVDRELLIPDHDQLPLFKIEFMNDRHEFKTVTSAQAKDVKVSKSRDSGGTTLTLQFKQIGQLPVDARVTIRCPERETLTYWSLDVDNRTTSWIGHIQFPVVEVPFDDPAGKRSSHILWSFGDGALSGPVSPMMDVGAWDWKLDGPWYGRTYDTPEIWRSSTYPGEWTTTQLMAYYDDVGGLYVALDDPKGLPKFIDPVMEHDGVTMGLGHYPGTRGPGITKLPYHVVLGTFHGDWYTAAEIYRNWASQQPFCSTKLADRTDIPRWIANSGPAIAFPMRGQAGLGFAVNGESRVHAPHQCLALSRQAGGGARRPPDADCVQLGAPRPLDPAPMPSRRSEARLRFGISWPRRKHGAGIRRSMVTGFAG